MNSGYYKRVSRQAKELSRLDNDNIVDNDDIDGIAGGGGHFDHFVEISKFGMSLRRWEWLSRGRFS